MRTTIPVIFVLLVAGCVGGPAVKQGDTVTLDYTLIVDGSIADTSVGRQPFSFAVGAGQVIQGFDEAVIGMKIGEEKTFTVPPAKGYGESGSHPLAGKTLLFEIKIIDIKSA